MNNIEIFVKRKCQEINNEHVSAEKPLQKRRGRPKKNIIHETNMDIRKDNLSASKNEILEDKGSGMSLNNFGLFNGNPENGMDFWNDLTKTFKKALEDKSDRVSLRVNSSLREFYKNLGGKMGTNMVLALEAMKVIYEKYFLK